MKTRRILREIKNCVFQNQSLKERLFFEKLFSVIVKVKCKKLQKPVILDDFLFFETRKCYTTVL